jgi:hypothetical protein
VGGFFDGGRKLIFGKFKHGQNLQEDRARFQKNFKRSRHGKFNKEREHSCPPSRPRWNRGQSLLILANKNVRAPSAI